MPAATQTPKRSTRKGSGSKRNRQRKLLRDARERVMLEAVPAYGADPVEALQEVLEGALAQLRVARERSGKLTEQELWRDTMVGKIPNEWIRLEADLRQEVAHLAGRMIGLDIAGRNAAAAEAIAEVMVPLLDGIFADLRLTPKQRERAPEVVAGRLKLLEGGAGQEGDRAA